MAKTFLRLNGGAGNIVDLNNPPYFLQEGWSPRVAKRNNSFFGRQFGFVNESIPLRVSAATVDDVLSALNDLAVIMDRSWKWFQETEGVFDSVVLEYTVRDSSSTIPLKSTVWGIPDEAENLMDLPIQFNRDIEAFETPLINLQLVRLGTWLEDSETASSISVSNPGKAAVTFANTVSLPSPTKLEFDGFDGTTLASGSKGFILIADALSKIGIHEAETGTTSAPVGGTFAVVADGNASGGQIQRLTPGSLGDYKLEVGVALNSTSRRFAVFSSMRNNSTTVSYKIRMEFEETALADSKPIVVDTSSQNPRIVFLGIVTTRTLGFSANLVINPSTTGGAGDELDIDHTDILVLDDNSFVTSFNDINSKFTSATEITIDHNTLTDPRPSFFETRQSDGSLNFLSYGGDLYITNTGNRIVFAMIGNTDTHWRIVNDASTVVSSSLTATRTKMFLTPL